jgi:UDP-glucose 4-epimerase
MKAIVTGGAGFIGSNLADALINLGWSVSVIDDLSSGKLENLNPAATLYKKDIVDPSVREAFEKARPDVVFHLAAQISVADSVRNPLKDARVNLEGSLNLLQSCVEFGVGKFIFSSSGGTIYGETPGEPATEEFPLRPFAPYGISKMALESYLNFFSIEHGLKFTALRYGNVYGPRQDPHGEAGVVAIFARAMLEGRTPTINGDGSCARDYVYVGDVVRANIAAIDKGHNGAFNIGTGKATDVNEVYAQLSAATGFTTPAIRGPFRAGDLKRSVLNNSLAATALGWSPLFSLEEGMKLTVDFFSAQTAKNKAGE